MAARDTDPAKRAGALEGRRRARSAQYRVLAGARRMLPGRPQLRAKRPKPGRRRSRPPPIPPSASACTRRAWRSSSSAWITRRPRSSAKPTRRPATSTGSSSRRAPNVHQLEAKYSDGAKRPRDKPVPWWDGPQPAGKSHGTLKQVDCLGKQARLIVEGDDHKTVRLLVTDPAQGGGSGTGELKLGCGAQKPRRGGHRILPQTQCPPGNRGRGGHHRVPVSPNPRRRAYRWLVLAVFVLSSAINYLDRQTLATLAPVLRAEFHLSNAHYGLILAAFSITYAASAPFAGMLIDRRAEPRHQPGGGRVVCAGHRHGLHAAGWAAWWAAGRCWAPPKPPAFPRREGHPSVSAAGRTRAGQRASTRRASAWG